MTSFKTFNDIYNILNIQFIYNIIKHSIHLQYYHLITTKRNKEEYMTLDDNNRNTLIYCDWVKMLSFHLKYFMNNLFFPNIFYIFALLGDLTNS